MPRSRFLPHNQHGPPPLQPKRNSSFFLFALHLTIFLMALNLPSTPSNKFKPTDEELIQFFLYYKVNGKPLPKQTTILECDLYGEKNPWEIWEAFGESNSYDGKDLYFFTTLKKKFLTSSRMVRTIGLGSWEGEDVGKVVMAKGTNQRIGLKKRFRFEKSGTSHDGAWILHEYSLDSSLLASPYENNYVLCRFRKNIRHNARQETSIKTTRQQEEIRVTTRQRRTIVLGIEATTESANNDVGIVEDIQKEPRKQSENGDKKIETVQTTSKIEPNYKEREDGDLTTSWPELFALQLREINQDILIQEEDIPMIPNTFCKDFLSQKIDNL